MNMEMKGVRKGSVVMARLEEHGSEMCIQRFCSNAKDGEMLRYSLYYKVL